MGEGDGMDRIKSPEEERMRVEGRKRIRFYWYGVIVCLCRKKGILVGQNEMLLIEQIVRSVDIPLRHKSVCEVVHHISTQLPHLAPVLSDVMQKKQELKELESLLATDEDWEEFCS